MTLCQIYQYIQYLANKHQKGGTFTPTGYNLALQDINMQVFNDEKSKFNPDATIPDELKRFKTSVSAGTITTGVYTLPGTYAELISRTFSALDTEGIRRFGRILPEDAAKRLISYPAARLDQNPIGVLRSGTINIYPSNFTSLRFEYLSLPATPVFDYYIDANLNVQCLSAGSTYVLQAGEEGSAGQAPPTPVTSLTVELDWGIQIHPRIILLLLGKLGIHIREADIVNFVESQKPQTR